MPSYEKVFVTGGAGLIGSHIVDLLVAGQDDGDLRRRRRVRQPHPWSARQPRRRRWPSGKVEVVEGDIRDVDALDVGDRRRRPRVPPRRDPDHALRRRPPSRAWRCSATARSTSSTPPTAPAPRRSSRPRRASVYGMAEDFPTTEQHHPYDNRTLYGAIKTFNEGLLRSYNDMFGLDYVALAVLQRVRPAHGRVRQVHRGADPVDGAHHRRRGTDDLR